MSQNLVDIIDYIISQSLALKSKYLGEDHLPLYYLTIFSQSAQEFAELKEQTDKLGKVVRQHNGPVYELAVPVKSKGYEVKILRIREPDPATPQRGHVDFVVKNYEELKKRMFSLYPENFSTLQRPEHELLGLKDPDFNVKVYFIG